MSALVERAIPKQQQEALIQANVVRRAQRAWKDQVAVLSPAAGRREAARVLLEDPGSVGAITIYAFLTAVPKIGDWKARRILTNRTEGWYIWPFRKVRELTPHQRARLAEELLR